MHKAILPAASLLLIVSSAAAQSQAPQSQTPPAKSSQRPNDCRFVVASEPSATPYKLCMTRADWTAKLNSDSKDANRLVCHYEDAMGNRFKAYKLCMSAAQWDRRRMDDRQALERIQQASHQGH
jgi:hypothetical protein